jgi:hypothetical protein
MENNKLIAEFMGLVKEDTTYTSGKSVDLDNETSIDLNTAVKNELLKYHTSWDWLMPVVMQIKEVHNVEFTFAEFDDTKTIIKKINPYDYALEQVYGSVVEFIKLYNEKDK